MKKKNILFYLLAFLIPFIIINLVFVSLEVSYFNKNYVLTSDMEAQYLPLFNYFKNVINGTESLFYSFSSGLGNSMLSTISYYLASPLNLILLLFKEENLYQGILFLMTLKIALSGLTMYIYLNKKFDNRLYALMFSVMYSLMAFNINNFFNIMWFDGIILLPLIIMGIDKIIKNKSTLLFGITLFLAILSNYYIGYMLCIFSCIYFIYEIILNYKKGCIKIVKKQFLRFSITGVLAALMTSFLIIPGILELSSTNKSMTSIFDISWSIKQNLLDIISKTIIGSQNFSNIINYKTVNIYICLIVIPLVFFYFVNKKINIKEKALSFSVILIFITSIMFEPLSKIWHGFSLPQGFNYRFSFIFCFFIIYIAYKSFINIKEIKFKKYLIFFIIYVLLCVFTLFSIKVFYPKYLIYISIGLVLIYLVILKNIEKKDMKLLLIILVMGELFFNMKISLGDYEFGTHDRYTDNITNIKEVINSYKPSNKEFYRIEKSFNYTLNDALLLDYNGVNHFLSTANTDVIKFLQKLGLSGNNMNINYENSSKIVDNLLGIKYILSEEELVEYKLIEQPDYYVYQNEDVLNLGYMVSNNVYKYENKEINDYLYQNYIMDLMTSKKDIYSEIEILNDNFNYQFNTTLKANYIYLAIDNTEETGTVEMKNGIAIYKFLNNGLNLIKLPYDMKDTVFNFVLNKEKKYTDINLSIKAYVLNEEIYEQSLNELKDEQLEIINSSNDYILGEINVNKEGVLFLSIPYDKNFKITVDKKSVNYNKLFDTFIGIDLKEGKHTIEIKYETKYLKEGICISIISITIFIIYIIYQKKAKNN